ncbi:MAG TPA: FGGY-family carbohydrate kinase [Planctomycetota bacterium]|nr:FGGY-family carbohydrate kinase [Planctomycetota bacterium]
MSLLGIDVGSGSCKAVVFSETGGVLAKASREYARPPRSPQPGMFEIDADEFWRAVAHVIRSVAANARPPVCALAISSHGETFVPVDMHGAPIAAAVMNADSRAVEQSDSWRDSLGENRIYEITGLPLHPMFALNKLMWLKRHQPEVFDAAAKFVSVEDYILLKLGMPAVTDYTLASRTMAFDIRRKRWSAEILDAAGVPESKLPEAVPSGTQVGVLAAGIAADLGLPPGVLVATGGHDQPCGALGAGVIDAGDVADSAGTYECMTAASREPRNTARALAYSLNSYCHAVPDRYVTLAFFPAGVAVRWFVEQFCTDEQREAERRGVSVYDVLAERLPDGPTGLCITPHFIGSCNPYWDVRATGVAVGLTPAITRHHVYKALYEGIACELALNAGVLEEICGRFDSITITGGGAASPFTVQLRAALAGKRIRTLQSMDAVCQGAAMLAGIAAGIYRDAEDAVHRAVHVGEVVESDAGLAAAYDRQLRQYKAIFPALEAVRDI